MSVTFNAIISVIIVSLISLIGIIPLIFKKKLSSKTLLLLVSLSAGSLFGAAIIHLIPEATEKAGFTLNISIAVLIGIVTFFILEKLIHWHHAHHEFDEKHKPIHGHAYHLAPMNLIGDGIHNFIDGMIIAASYLVSVPLGIATTVSVALHEIPQEIADFGVLLYAGLSRFKALLFNLLSAGAAIVGAILVLSFKNAVVFHKFMIPFAAGGFLYIAGANLVPELHKHCSLKQSFYHFLAMSAGICIMLALELFHFH